MKKFQIMLTVLIVAVILAVSPVYATPMLRLSDGTTTVNVTGAAGVVNYNGAVGNFIINVSTGLSKPVFGSVALPAIDLNSISLTDNAGGTLTIMLTDVGFGPLNPGVTGFSTRVGGVTDGTAKFSYWLDDGNGKFQTTTLLGGGSYTGAFSDTAYMPLSPSSSFSLTNIAEIYHGDGRWQSTSFNQVVNPIPEPGTLLLLGSGVVGVVAYARKKRCLLNI